MYDAFDIEGRYELGLLTLMVIVVVVLAIVGLGWRTFFSGVSRGAEKVGGSSVVKNVTNEARELASNATANAAKDLIGRIT